MVDPRASQPQTGGPAGPRRAGLVLRAWKGGALLRARGGPRQPSRLTKADSGGGVVHPVEPQGGPRAEAVETTGETEAQ